ncbi:MAG: 4Fe-4S binding protein [Chloroflexi bacterium]|nr:4Fe-4S binding protein [Chloroflexota bacterium]
MKASIPSSSGPAAAHTNRGWRRDLLRVPLAGVGLRSRWPQFLLRAITLAGFVFTILAGLFGPAVGSHNFAIIFVWIAWWSALKLVFIPLGGRAWCSVCPLPMPAEWLRRGGILSVRRPGPGAGRRWPRRLRGRWLQAAGFLGLGLASAVTLTSPRLTGWVLLAVLLLALVVGLFFERRAFCNYLCPIGGFTGLYAQAAPLELRVKDRRVCATHAEKTCYQVCPWGVYPLALQDNTACGLCMECVRACPLDNLALNLRPPGSDWQTPRRQAPGETFLSLAMLGSAAAYAAVFLGPWGGLKSAAYALGSWPWLAYAAGFLGLTVVTVPGLFVLFTAWSERYSGRGRPLGEALAGVGAALSPLGLAAWMAFTVSFALAKLGYVAAVLADPLGRGWNLLGARGWSWGAVDLAGVVPGMVIALLLAGLAGAGHMIAARTPGRRAAAPLLVFCLLYTLAMLWLLVG